MKSSPFAGHAAAFVTTLIWGTTFISTKVLLRVFTPSEILLLRFAIGYFALWCAFPHPLAIKDRRQELCFLAAGLCGVTLYYLFENMALTYTLASNVGVIISIAPFFRALFSLVTLPVEYNASARAVEWHQTSRTMQRAQLAQAKEALSWAARTYLVAALSAIASVLYYAMFSFLPVNPCSTMFPAISSTARQIRKDLPAPKC